VTVSFWSTSLGKQCTSYNVPPTSWICAVDHWALQNFLPQAPFSWSENPRNCTGRDLNWILCSDWKNSIGGTPSEHPPYSPDLAPYDIWTFPTMKRELWGKKFWSDQWSAARFWEVGGVL
jgi:hypothetical protein